MIYLYVENPELIIDPEEELINIDEFPFEVVEQLPEAPRKRGERKKRRIGEEEYVFHFVDCIGTNDLESTKIPEVLLNEMYINMFDFYMNGDHYYVACRTWERFEKFLNDLAYTLGEDENGIPRTINIWIFNMGYDMYFEKSHINYEYIFFKDTSHPLYAVSHNRHFFWHDAQALFGPGGLKAATEGLPHAKLVGDLDYSRKVFSWSKIDWKSFRYCINDCLGLAEAIEKEMQVHNVGLYGLKNTLTGWTRKSCNAILTKIKYDYKPLADEDNDIDDLYELYEEEEWL